MALQAADGRNCWSETRLNANGRGLEPSNKGNDRIDFKIHIDRPDKPALSDKATA
jgi:hypothetical protein